jgi:hypothetical protein
MSLTLLLLCPCVIPKLLLDHVFVDSSSCLHKVVPLSVSDRVKRGFQLELPQPSEYV